MADETVPDPLTSIPILTHTPELGAHETYVVSQSVDQNSSTEDLTNEVRKLRAQFALISAGSDLMGTLYNYRDLPGFFCDQALRLQINAMCKCLSGTVF